MKNKTIVILLITIILLASFLFAWHPIEKPNEILAQVIYVNEAHGYSTFEDLNGNMWAYEGTEFPQGSCVSIAHEGAEIFWVKLIK